jgi:hypothetical protein
VALGATAVLIAVSGGFRTTVGGFRISMRSPLPAGAGALLAGAAWFFLARRRRSIAADLEAWWLAIERHATRIIGVLALTSAIIASTFATRSAAGADASGYLSQARFWTSGMPMLGDDLSVSLADVVGQSDWTGQWLTTPLGWRPVSVPGLQVPTYPPGLPLLMSLPHRYFGIAGATAVVMAAAAASVWATGMLAGGVAGVVAAVLVGLMPAFIYQSIQPMSDVPVTAAWMLCFLFLRNNKPELAGYACALAVLIRPNLAPLAIVPLALSPRRLAFAWPVALVGAFLAVVQNGWYGSPLRSGYGSADELFALANVRPNAERYSQWLVTTAPVLLLAPFGVARARRDRRALGLAVFATLVIAAYLVYAVFDQWSYLRFVLPALAVFAVFAGIELTAWMERCPVVWRAPLVCALLIATAAHGLWLARSLEAFRLRDQLARVGQVADYVNQAASANAVIVSGEQSGAMRYYTDRSILRWDAAMATLVSASVETLERAGRPTLIVLDAWEEEPFRRKFASDPALQLDWPPAVEAGSSHRTKLWKISDRAKFLSGERVETLRLP